MNIRWILVLLVAAFSIYAGAQGKHPAGTANQDAVQYGARLYRMSPTLTKQLSLTAAQSKQMRAIDAKYEVKMKAAFQPGPGKPHDMEGMRPIFMWHWNALYAVLTAKQKTSLKKWVDSHPRG